MTVTFRLSAEEEDRMRAGAARQDREVVREILLRAVDPTVEGILRSWDRRPQPSALSALLDRIAARLRDAPALSDEAVSRAGIYADHP